MTMALGFCFGLALLLLVGLPAKSDDIPEGAILTECRDRYFMIAVDLSLTGDEFHFEAADGTGVYPLTAQYAAMCGYTASVFHLRHGFTELRASYFSCHTDNKDDKVFVFHFNLKTFHNGTEITYAINKTCSPSLPWSPREVTCESNYMEVSVKSDVACPTGTKSDDWNDAVQTAYASATSDWQVIFQRGGQLIPMELSEAHKQGYMFDLTDGRLVFRTPYRQPDAVHDEIKGIPVEVVYATLFSRQGWVVLMVDLVAACSMYEASFDENGYVVWKTPEALHPLVSGSQDTLVKVGVNGEPEELPDAEGRGYIVEKNDATVEISIPYNAEGVYRKSIVNGDLYEYISFHLYVEQISEDEDHIVTRLRFHRTLASPLLPRSVFIENRTVREEHMFTICLGDVPEDVELTAVELNGHRCTAPFTNTSGHTVTKVSHPNNTQVYMLKVPFDDPVVIHQLSKEDAAMKHMLDINYTLTVLPEHEPYFHLTSVMARTDVSPPQFDAICSESGISFKLDHRPFGFLWYASVGSERLTPELAAEHGYIMSNNSQSLMLEVPLLTQGYEYKDITLRGFLGTFEMLLRDHETSEVLSSTVKTCPFNTTEMIMCSTNGRMTVVADLSLTIPSGGTPGRAHLTGKYCVPKATDNTRALFSFPLNSCGSVIKLRKEYVTYENEIFFTRKFNIKNPMDSSIVTDRITIKCTYPLAGLHRLFSAYKFESETVGVGQIVHSAQSAEGPLQAEEFAAVFQTPVPVTRRTRPGHRHHVQQKKVYQHLKNGLKGAVGASQA